MFCPKCGTNVPEGSKFCESCGNNMQQSEQIANSEQQPEQDAPPQPQQTPPPQPMSQPRPQQAPPPPVYNPQPAPAYQPNTNSYQPRPQPAPAYQYNAANNNDPREKVYGIGGWIGTLIVSFIPIVGFIMMLVWAFGSNTNKTKKNWAIAMLIIGVIFTIIGIVLYATIFAALGSFMDQLGGYDLSDFY
jgi:predicted nucleic acid-binding Zn ribbon protein